MKRAALILAALAVILPAAAATVRMATESFVVSKIAEAMPGNYATVSNAAMSALQPGEGGIVEETDPTVHAWAKQSAPPVTTNDVENIVTNEVEQFEWVVTVNGETTDNYEVSFTEVSGLSCWWLSLKVPRGGEVVFDSEIYGDESWTGLRQWYAAIGEGTIERKSLKRNSLGLATREYVTAAIREQSLGGIWDEELQVWWTPRMRTGSLTYEATTNVNLNAEN